MGMGCESLEAAQSGINGERERETREIVKGEDLDRFRVIISLAIVVYVLPSWTSRCRFHYIIIGTDLGDREDTN